MRFEHHLKELAKITDKTPYEVLQIIERTAQEVKINSTEFLRRLFVKLERLTPYSYFKIREYLNKHILYSEVLRLFKMLEELGLIEKVGKIKGKGRYGLIIFKIVEGKEDHEYWNNPRKYYYRMIGWKSQ